MSCSTPKSIDYLSLLPDTIQNQKYNVFDETVTFENNHVYVSVRYLNPGMLNGYYQGKNLLNPFVNFPEDKKFTIFAVKFQNNSKEQLTYNPMMSAIYEGNEKPVRPIDVTDFYFILSSTPEGESRMQIIKKTIYDVQFILKSGEKREAILVFPAIDLSTKVVALVLRDIYIGHKWTDIPFAFNVIDKSKVTR